MPESESRKVTQLTKCEEERRSAREKERKCEKEREEAVPWVMTSAAFLRDDVVRTEFTHSLTRIMSQSHTTLAVIVSFIRTFTTPTDFTERGGETCPKANPRWWWRVAGKVNAIGESDGVVRGEGVRDVAGEGERDGRVRGRWQDPKSGDGERGMIFIGNDLKWLCRERLVKSIQTISLPNTRKGEHRATSGEIKRWEREERERGEGGGGEREEEEEVTGRYQ
jgi:hypothetical protein